MHVHLDHHSGEPIYRQIVESIKFLIARGDLATGSRLPSIRELASQLNINSRTVVKAYEELDRTGLVVLQQGRGVFVTEPKAVTPARERRKALQEQVRRLLAEAARLGASPDEVIDIVNAIAAELTVRP